MCTVTFSPRQRGYALAMNRDEKRTRAIGLPPAETIVHGRRVLAPSEPGGGTWLAVNDSGVAFALINWHAIAAPAPSRPVSRGGVVQKVCTLPAPDSVPAALKQLPLEKINPFRLIGVFPGTRQIMQWQWNLRELMLVSHHWQAQQWISSGFDEPAAQRVRSQTFRRALQQKSAGSLDWLRRLHRSHSPQAGPFSTCMHRRDAATVSCTDIVVSPVEITLRHHNGTPCQRGVSVTCQLPFGR